MSRRLVDTVAGRAELALIGRFASGDSAYEAEFVGEVLLAPRINPDAR